MTDNKLFIEITAHFNKEIHQSKPLSTGHNARLIHITLDNRQEYIIKIASNPSANMTVEGKMLQYLSEHSPLQVPQPHYWTQDYLVMDYVKTTPHNIISLEENAAYQLSQLHQISHTQFGFFYDTVIGPLHQPNPLLDDWLHFFAEHRLLAMAEAARKAQLLDTKTLADIETLIGKLDRYIEKEPPALIHGDIWSGNILSHNGKAVFIDPAIYFAHREIELAFIMLFHSFGKKFFNTYQNNFPITDGFFEVRKDLYNLYPLLVHLRIYGPSYLGQIQTILQYFV